MVDSGAVVALTVNLPVASSVARSASVVICQLWLLRPSTMSTRMRSFAGELPLTRIPSKQVKRSDLKILTRFVYAKIPFTACPCTSVRRRRMPLW